ncbi:MAG: hypothetical protein ACLSFZ_09745 [Frisingicoccus sp.]
MYGFLKTWGSGSRRNFIRLFDTVEIQGILNMLRILDNPLQDIPMAAVLTSSMGRLNDEELAELRLVNRSVHV